MPFIWDTKPRHWVISSRRTEVSSSIRVWNENLRTGMCIFGGYSRGPLRSSMLTLTEPALVCARRSVAGAVSRLIVCAVSVQKWLSCCAVHIFVVNRGDVFRHSFTKQVSVTAYCTLVLWQTILATYKLKPAGLEALSETSSRLCGALGFHDAQQVCL
jgi:hypothetical protein